MEKYITFSWAHIFRGISFTHKIHSYSCVSTTQRVKRSICWAECRNEMVLWLKLAYTVKWPRWHTFIVVRWKKKGSAQLLLRVLWAYRSMFSLPFYTFFSLSLFRCLSLFLSSAISLPLFFSLLICSFRYSEKIPKTTMRCSENIEYIYIYLL